MIRGVHVWACFALLLFGMSLGHIFRALGWNPSNAVPFSIVLGAPFGSVGMLWLMRRSES